MSNSIIDKIIEVNVHSAKPIQLYLNSKIKELIYAISLDTNEANAAMVKHLSKDSRDLNELDEYINTINIPQTFRKEIEDGLLEGESFPTVFEFKAGNICHHYIVAQASIGGINEGQLYRITYNADGDMFIVYAISFEDLLTTTNLELAFPQLFDEEYLKVKAESVKELEEQLSFLKM